MGIHDTLQMGLKYLQNLRFLRLDRIVDIVGFQPQLIGRRNSHRTFLRLMTLLIGWRD